mgnify:FL=1
MKKGRNLLRKLSAFLLMAMISVPLLGSDSGASCVQAAGQKEKAAVSEMTVHYLDVGQGDCVLVSCDGESMLIDAGDNNQGTKIQNYLKKQGVTKLKYAVGTHPDADHIGGLDVILYKFDCGTVMMPDVSKNTATYRDVVDTMKQKGYRNTVPEPGDSFQLGDAVCTVLGPEESYEDANNNSIVLKVEHGENSFLFMGDAEAEAESDILSGGADVEADVLKVGHHGSRSSSSQKFLKAVDPAYAVISCGEDNSYGHPHAETLNNLRAMGVDVFRSDEQGTIVAVSDGSQITWNSAPSESWKAGEPTGGSSTGSSKTQSKLPGTESKSSQNAGNDGSQSSTGNAGAGSSAAGNTGNSAVTAEASGGEAAGNTQQAQESIKQETAGTQVPAGEAPVSGSYIGNKNNGKLHKASCSYLPMEKNQALFATREDAVAAGYSDPCKKCNP